MSFFWGNDAVRYSCSLCHEGKPIWELYYCRKMQHIICGKHLKEELDILLEPSIVRVTRGVEIGQRSRLAFECPECFSTLVVVADTPAFFSCEHCFWDSRACKVVGDASNLAEVAIATLKQNQEKHLGKVQSVIQKISQAAAEHSQQAAARATSRKKRIDPLTLTKGKRKEPISLVEDIQIVEHKEINFTELSLQSQPPNISELPDSMSATACLQQRLNMPNQEKQLSELLPKGKLLVPRLTRSSPAPNGKTILKPQDVDDFRRFDIGMYYVPFVTVQKTPDFVPGRVEVVEIMLTKRPQPEGTAVLKFTPVSGKHIRDLTAQAKFPTNPIVITSASPNDDTPRADCIVVQKQNMVVLALQVTPLFNDGEAVIVTDVELEFTIDDGDAYTTTFTLWISLGKVGKLN